MPSNPMVLTSTSSRDISPPDLDPVISLLTTYNELNSSSVDEFTELPSALEFMRYVARNRPFVVRGGARDWEATRTWDVNTLKSLLEGQSVNVAVTPKGWVWIGELLLWGLQRSLFIVFRNADSPTLNGEGELIFVKPYEEQQPFDKFVDYVANQEKSGDMTGEVKYAQTRETIIIASIIAITINWHTSENDNLRNEYSTLFSHVDADIPWARIALEQKPEAINLCKSTWHLFSSLPNVHPGIGNSRSVTALHKDNYENIYVQIIGAKHFVLLPPLFYACVAEAELPTATYTRSSTGSLEIQLDEGEENVPFAIWDPDGDESGYGTRYSRYAEPVRVTLKKGDMLYLPALWWDFLIRWEWAWEEMLI